MGLVQVHELTTHALQMQGILHRLQQMQFDSKGNVLQGLGGGTLNYSLSQMRNAAMP